MNAGPIRMELKRNTKRGKNNDFTIDERIELIGSGYYNKQRVFARLKPFMTRDVSSVRLILLTPISVFMALKRDMPPSACKSNCTSSAIWSPLK